MAVARSPSRTRRPLSQGEIQAREEKRRQRQRERELWELSRGPIDLPFSLLVMLLSGIGLVMLLSASFFRAYVRFDNPTYYFTRQIVFMVIGVVAMHLIGKINYQRFRGLARPLLYVSIVLLVLVAIPGIGLVRNNSRRWLGVPGVQSFQFQPSEIAKVAVVLYFADTISKKKDRMMTFRQGVAPYAAILVLLGGLMMLEPHLSGTILIFTAGAVLMLVGGIAMKWVAAAGGATAVLGYLVVGVFHYGKSRIEMWHNPWQDAQIKGYQLVQSLLAIGSGGLWGSGLGRSSQKFLYLPEEFNDFIFAIICEELGLIGATIIMLLFAALILRGYWIALHARDRFGSLLVVGITTLVAMQTFLNIGVVTGFLPTTGISLPFFSYGGTALCVQFAEMGIVLSVSRQMKPTKSG